MALFHFALEMFHLEPEAGRLVPSGSTVTLPGWVALGSWLLESIGLAALFLLIHARGGWGWLAGLLSGWIAWIFRGPLLVVTVVRVAGLPPGPWWSLAILWLILYSICGLLLGFLSSVTGLQPAY